MAKRRKTAAVAVGGKCFAVEVHDEMPSVWRAVARRKTRGAAERLKRRLNRMYGPHQSWYRVRNVCVR
jgi:hypothetical protein